MKIKTKSNIAETTGALAGTGLGVGGATMTISSLGTAGLSGAGLTSGLAAIGSSVGFTTTATAATSAMIVGFAVATAGVGVLAVAGLIGGTIAYKRYKASKISR